MWSAISAYTVATFWILLIYRSHCFSFFSSTDLITARWSVTLFKNSFFIHFLECLSFILFFFVLVKSKSLFRRHSFLAWNFELDRHFDWNVLSAKKLFSFFPLTHLAVLLLCTSLLLLCASYASWNATFGDTGGRVYAVLNCNVFRPNQRIGTKKKNRSVSLD